MGHSDYEIPFGVYQEIIWNSLPLNILVESTQIQSRKRTIIYRPGSLWSYAWFCVFKHYDSS